MNPIGEGAERNVPPLEDVMEELGRANERHYQWGHICVPDPDFCKRRAHLQAPKPDVPLGPLNAMPTFSNASRAAQRVVNAAAHAAAVQRTRQLSQPCSSSAAGAAPAAVDEVPRQLNEMQTDYGLELSKMPREAVLAQLRLRRVKEDELVGKKGSSKHLGSLRKILIAKCQPSEAASAEAPAAPASDTPDASILTADADAPGPAAAATMGSTATATGVTGDAAATAAPRPLDLMQLHQLVGQPDEARPRPNAMFMQKLLGSQNWAKCDKCDKWRRLPRGVKFTNAHLPEEWNCSLNPHPLQNRCSDVEEQMQSDEEWDGGDDDDESVDEDFELDEFSNDEAELDADSDDVADDGDGADVA